MREIKEGDIVRFTAQPSYAQYCTEGALLRVVRRRTSKWFYDCELLIGEWVGKRGPIAEFSEDELEQLE
jgi:hypothetical protein